MEEKTNKTYTGYIIIAVALVLCAVIAPIAWQIGGKLANEKKDNNIVNNVVENVVENITENTTKTTVNTPKLIDNNYESIWQLESDTTLNGVSVYQYSDRVVVGYNGYVIKDNLSTELNQAYVTSIDNVFVVSLSILGAQCNTKYVLIFNTDGKLLYDYTNYQVTDMIIDKPNKTLMLDVLKNHECWCCACDGPDCYAKNYTTYKISGKTITIV